MRTLKNLGFPQDGDDSLFPDGQIRNETSTQQGTPVVREIYGDILTNIYKILRDAGLDPNELEDSENNGYQLLKALKIFSNELNDLSQVITVSANSMSVNFDFDSLPNDYVFIGVLSNPISSSTSYTLSGLGSNTLNFNSALTVPASSIVLVTLSQPDINLTPLGIESQRSFLLTPYTGVISYNSTDNVTYMSDGYLINNNPESFNIQQTIRIYENDASYKIADSVIHKDKLIVIAKAEEAKRYSFYIFSLNELTTVENKFEYDQDGTLDHLPFLYANSDFLFLTNNGNNSSSDNILDKIDFDTSTGLSKVSEITLNQNFQKTTNAFVRNDSIFTYISGNLNEYNFSGDENFRFFINNINGQLFSQNDKIYITSGELAVPFNA